MTENLKRCPFCGGEAEIIDDAMGTISRCRRCGAENGNGVYGDVGHKLAVKDWNARPIEDELHGKIGKLEAENVRLREALGKIIGETKDYERRLPGPSFVVIRIYAEKAMKGDKE